MLEARTGPFAAALPPRVPSGGPLLARAPAGLSVVGQAGVPPVRA